MEHFYDIKWQKDFLSHVSAFKSFVFEGNVHDLHPILIDKSYKYKSTEEVIADLIKENYCVVFFDHTKQPGGEIKEPAQGSAQSNGQTNTQENQLPPDAVFNSFTFLEKEVVDKDGKTISNPNIELFKKYYKKDYLDKLKSSTDRAFQGGLPLDMQRIFDAMKEYGENVTLKEEKEEINGFTVTKLVPTTENENYKNTKPFLFILPNVSRYMTTSGRPDSREHSVLMVLYKATQLNETPCKVVLLVDKMNDLPTWFEAEDNNPSLKKFFIPAPNSKFRNTYFELELKDKVFNKVDDPALLNKFIKKFEAYTENYSLRKLEQLNLFVTLSNESADKNLGNIDKTVFKFEFGINEDLWKSPEMFGKINNLQSELTNVIKGQDEVCKKIEDTLRVAVTGLNSTKSNDRRPKAVFFLAGPTGTGKTEISKTLARILFGKEDSMIRFDMSEFKEAHNQARLFGAPPGYVGYDAGGELTKALKERPFSIILFDEIEKADPSIWDKFLQILGDGRITDGKGETVYFSQSVIIFTSNLGITSSDPRILGKLEIDRQKLVDDEIKYIEEFKAATSDEEKQKCLNELRIIENQKAHLNGIFAETSQDEYFKLLTSFKPGTQWQHFCSFVSEAVTERIKLYFDAIHRREVLGRIGEKNIMVFNYIDQKDAGPAIVKSTIKNFVQYLANDNEITVELDATDEEVLKFINEKCLDLSVINLGGRGIVMTVEKLLAEPVSQYIFYEMEAYRKDHPDGALPTFKAKLIIKYDEICVLNAN